MKYLRTDIYDMNKNGNIVVSSEIAEEWGNDYESAIAYLVKRGGDEKSLRSTGVSGGFDADGQEKSFSVCVWDRDEYGATEWLDNASTARYSEHLGTEVK